MIKKKPATWPFEANVGIHAPLSEEVNLETPRRLLLRLDFRPLDRGVTDRSRPSIHCLTIFTAPIGR